MGTRILKFINKRSLGVSAFIRSKTTSTQYVESRARDPTFEKLMDKYKELLKVIAIQDLILANPKNPSLSIEFLSRKWALHSKLSKTHGICIKLVFNYVPHTFTESTKPSFLILSQLSRSFLNTRLSQRLHLNRGATAFLRKYPHIFAIYYDPAKLQPFCRLTDAALDVSRQEAKAIDDSMPVVVDRLIRILAMSTSRTVPLRAIFKVWRELGLPDDFEDSVIAARPNVFQLCDAQERNTHLLKLVSGVLPSERFRAAVEDWRVVECCKEDCSVDRTELQFSFKHGYPPGMRLSKNFRAKVKEWQSFPYVGPYEELVDPKKTKAGMRAMEKRAVSIVHEFMSLTVEKMVEVEKISQFRKWFGIDLNIRDLFLDHPGIFYLSTKGKRHTVFLREAYERGCLIEPNPVYDARRRLLDLVLLGRRGLPAVNSKPQARSSSNEVGEEDN